MSIIVKNLTKVECDVLLHSLTVLEENIMTEILFVSGGVQVNNEVQEILNYRIPVMLAFVPSERATLLAESFGQSCDFELLNFAFSSESYHFHWQQFGRQRIFLASTRTWPTDLPKGTIVVDYLPKEPLNNYGFYSQKGLPFVAEVSASRRDEILSVLKNSNICAVIIPPGSDNFSLTNAAVDFLDKQMRNGTKGQVFTVTDVLNERERGY